MEVKKTIIMMEETKTIVEFEDDVIVIFEEEEDVSMIIVGWPLVRLGEMKKRALRYTEF